jgi:uncharacterized protein (TIGR03084 family)
MVDVSSVFADLAAESEELNALVAELPAERWATETPAQGWTIAHQIAHLAWTDDVAVLAVADPDAFAAVVAAVLEGSTTVDGVADESAAGPPAALLDRWRAGRERLAVALGTIPAGAKVPWFGPPMGAASMATARLMETWAHGLDVADTLGVIRRPSERLRHVAHIGVRARNFSFALNGLAAPAEEFRVELTGPSGDVWGWGPEDAAQRVRGPALDFCLLVTQRRHRDDLDLTASGPDAERWLAIAQAFAGPPGSGRARVPR